MFDKLRAHGVIVSVLFLALVAACGDSSESAQPAGSTGGEPGTPPAGEAPPPPSTTATPPATPPAPTATADAGTPVAPTATTAVDAGAPATPVATPPPSGGPRYTVTFVVHAVGRSAQSDAPRSRVGVLVTGPRRMRRAFGLGTLEGVIGPMSAEDTEGALGGISSWWAGAGAQITVSRVVESIVVQRREIGEGEGDQGSPPSPWTQVGRIDHVSVEAEVVIAPFEGH